MEDSLEDGGRGKKMEELASLMLTELKKFIPLDSSPSDVGFI
jgi:hypothetical protein